LGRTAYPLLNEKRIPLYLMTNILGGPGMNSRLNLSVREKHGLVYSIDAQYLAYADTGMFAIYFGTEPKQAKKCMALVHREMDKLFFAYAPMRPISHRIITGLAHPWLVGYRRNPVTREFWKYLDIDESALPSPRTRAGAAAAAPAR